MRSLSVIAREIEKEWVNVSPYAQPYLSAMKEIDSVDDDFYRDSGDAVVLYFLSNANGWRGGKAREIKAELRRMVYLK